MSKMHFHKKWVQNASNQLFLRLTFSFTSLLSNFFSTQVFSLLCIGSLVMHRSSFYSWLGFCCFATRNNSILFACLPRACSFICSFMGDKSWWYILIQQFMGYLKLGPFFSRSDQTKSVPQCLKITQNVSFDSFNFGNFQQFCHIKIDLSGNTVWLKASGF